MSSIVEGIIGKPPPGSPYPPPGEPKPPPPEEQKPPSEEQKPPPEQQKPPPEQQKPPSGGEKPPPEEPKPPIEGQHPPSGEETSPGTEAPPNEDNPNEGQNESHPGPGETGPGESENNSGAGTGEENNEEIHPPNNGGNEEEGSSTDPNNDAPCHCTGNGNTSNPNAEPQPAGPTHPLNQLNKPEIRQAVALIKARAISENISQTLNFAAVSLKEPPKKELLPYLSETRTKPARKAFTIFSPDGVNTAYEAIVNLDTQQVEEFTQLPAGTQPSFNTDDPLIAQDIARKDEGVQERAKKIGITNMENLICDAWSYGYNNTEMDNTNKRLMDMYMYERKQMGENQYAHPLDFLVTIDMISKEVIDIVDLPVCSGNSEEQERPMKPPQESHDYDPKVLPKDFYRDDIKPIQITQKQGPSFKIEGNRITWQNWDMIIGFNYREGLTLHNITFKDKNKKRGVLYRAAISEMVVPYGDPRIPFYRKSAFDMGEYGLGYNANSLTNGCDCLGEIRYMDFVYADSQGEPKVTKNAICIHEEDAGLLQKHTEFRNGNVTIARSRKLVISFIATVTNYDYAYYWMFYQDGTMEVDIKATGLLSVHSFAESCETGGYGTTVAPRINAPYHQHIFCARLDTMIDGENNSVAVQEVVPLEDPYRSDANPYGQGFTTTSTILEKSSDSGTDTDPDRVRSWLVMNEEVVHPYTKKPVGWKLVAPGFCRLLAGPESGVYKRAGFARHNVWVTPYNDDQLYAAGTYINQLEGDKDGVSVWAESDDGDIRNTDIVLWHSFGLTHIPRVEDYPLMPVEGASFVFRPTNFFNANPALDVPPPSPKKCL